jgi:hypothetical protein
MEALRILASWVMTVEMMGDADPDYREALERKVDAAAEALRLGVSPTTVERMGRFTSAEMGAVRRASQSPIDPDEFVYPDPGISPDVFADDDQDELHTDREEGTEPPPPLRLV